MSGREGQSDLLIRSVRLDDAGLYTATDEIRELEASANLTVIGFYPLLFYYGVLRSVRMSVCLCVCLSASISLKPLDRSSRSFVAVARSSSGGVAISYVLPVFWMTSLFAVMGRMATSLVAIPGRSLMSMSALFVLLLSVISPTVYAYQMLYI